MTATAPITTPQLATERLWRDHHGELRSFLRRRVGDADLAEDLLQTVFVKAHAGLGALADAERALPWLYRIARNAVIDHHRTRRVGEPLPEDLPQTASADEAERGAGLERCVRPMIEQMPAGYREAVLLADIQGLPLAEVAARLGLSLSGAKSRVQRGRAMLGRCFEACCELELDGRGKPIGWTARERRCPPEPCATVSGPATPCTPTPCTATPCTASHR
jgi:RNA polymerase sigma-70 factor (ECF subfamily)